MLRVLTEVLVTELDIEAIAITLESFLQNFDQTIHNKQNYSWQSISIQLAKIYQVIADKPLN